MTASTLAATRSPAERGRSLVGWSERRMPALTLLRERFASTRPLDGVRIAGSLHLTPETAAFARCLTAAGAEVALSGSNPLSTRDDVCASLREHDRIAVHARYGETRDEYYEHLRAVAAMRPHLVLDDGADLIALLASERSEGVRAGIEQTTTGVQRLRAMAACGALPFGVVALNDAPIKQRFDNRYGTGQNTLDGILRATNVLIAGKTLVVAGYGWAGRGVAERARGAGANVIITEVRPLPALEAYHDGFRVMPIGDACELADIIVTCTGCAGVVGAGQLDRLRDGVLLVNSGHFDVEIDAAALRARAGSVEQVRPDLAEYRMPDGRTVYLLAEGRLVGQSAAEASPADVMDLTFSAMALTVVWASSDPPSGVVLPPDELTDQVCSLKLEALGIRHDRLTDEQRAYVSSWTTGT